MKMHMVSLRRVLVGVAVMMIGTSSVMQAQERQGFFFGVGLGYGHLTESCDGCDYSAGGLSGHLRLGGTISERFLLGAESTGWYKSENGSSATTGTLTPNGYFYPAANTGLFVKGGAGIGSVSAGGYDEIGFGWQAGAGYDIRVGQKTAVTPTLTFFRGHFDGFSENVVQIALAFSLY